MRLKFWQKCILFIANVLYPCKIYGKENVPDGRAIIVSNHFSVIDAVNYLNISKTRPNYLAKKEITNNKLLGKIIQSFGAIPIDRDKPDMKAMLSVIRVLKDNEKVIIFPEGTRNKTGTTELQDIKGGSGVFSVKTKAPIVPAMLLSKPRILEKQKLLLHLQ